MIISYCKLCGSIGIRTGGVSTVNISDVGIHWDGNYQEHLCLVCENWWHIHRLTEISRQLLLNNQTHVSRH